jgi:excisionase family DNA binding protein
VTLLDEFRSFVEDAVRKVVREEISRGREPAATDDVLLSVSAAARLAGVAPGTIRMWMASGKLRRYRAGRVLRARRSELMDLLARDGQDDHQEDLSPESLADRHHEGARRRPRTAKHRGHRADTLEAHKGDGSVAGPDEHDEDP